MKMTSRFALVAAAGLLVGATVAPAKAADLGGGCCADLEERVAELEATTARKGNRVVSLQVYGQVNKALLFWDDGEESDVFVVDNDASSSRFGFQGTASIKPGWTAGYNMEFDLQADSNSNFVSANDDEGSLDGPKELRIRKNELYVESEQFGRVTLGQGSNAGDGITNIVLGNSISSAALDFGGAFEIVGGGRLDEVVSDLGTSRSDRVRYDSPSIYGFIASASWGEDDLVDVALRFKKEWNSIRLAAGVAYAEASENEGEFEQVSGSASVMHVPTGIFAAFAAGERETDDEESNSFWYAQLGVEKRFFGAGSTTVFAEYGEYDAAIARDGDAGVDAEVTKLGFGVVQSIDSAAMDLYATAVFWDYEDDGAGPNSEGDLTTVMVGSIIKF
jgi:predicted porin